MHDEPRAILTAYAAWKDQITLEMIHGSISALREYVRTHNFERERLQYMSRIDACIQETYFEEITQKISAKLSSTPTIDTIMVIADKYTAPMYFRAVQGSWELRPEQSTVFL